MIAAEKERDPDALDEEIISKVNKAINMQSATQASNETTMTQDTKKNKSPAIALGTVLATRVMEQLDAGNTDWRNQEFISKQKTVRVGGPPRGPPPTGGKPGAPPKGPPPSGGRRKTVSTPATGGASGKAAGAKGGAASSNSNIPAAPPIAHFMAYLKGNYDPANPPSSGGPSAEPPRQSEDLNFSPDAMITDAQGDMDDMQNMLDAIGGDDQPAVERSSIHIDAAVEGPPAEKPLSQMSLVEQLQAQALKLKPAGQA